MRSILRFRKGVDKRFPWAATGGAMAWAAYRHWRKNPNLVNDVHSKLNPTEVRRVVRPRSLDELIGEVRAAAREGDTLCASGSRHAMGGQQFAAGATLLDLRGLRRVIDFDSANGRVEVGAGIEWPDLLAWLLRHGEKDEPWTIRQKQTGADRLSVGGALSCNAHSRCLTRPPMVDDVDSILLVDPRGEPVRCSRTENADLFALAIGGYGLFGAIHSAVLRLERRHKQERRVAKLHADELPARFAHRIAEGYTMGDFQFAIDPTSDGFLTQGVFSCYRPVPWDTPIPKQKRIPRDAWARLVEMAHVDKAEAYRLYRDYYLSTDGQIYLSDTSLFGVYLGDYHALLDRKFGATVPGSEMISELFVPRDRLPEFLHGAAREMRRLEGNVVYGTVRLVCRDDVTFLRWAKDDYACVIFNLHVDHSMEGVARAKMQFRALIDLALGLGGNYYLTYHRWATREQVGAGYPQFEAFLAKKREFDPKETFQSDWYRHYRTMFA